MNNSYAAGSVSGDSAGGLVGVNESGATVTDAYWDTETTSQLKANTDLTGFYFLNTWGVVDNASYISYPYLSHNTQTPAPGVEQTETETPTPEPPTDTTPPSIT